MSKAKIKWLAITGFIIISLLCFLFHHKIIENDIGTRSLNALVTHNIKIESVIVDGRDVTLTGFVESENKKERAGALVAGLFGVRTVENKLQIREEVDDKTIAEEIPVEIARYADLSQLSGNIRFQTNSAALDSSSLLFLDEVVQILIDNTSDSMEISGHTDSRGGENVNLILSRLRADTVMNYLIQKGISKERLAASGYGSSQPVSDNTTAEGRQLNRRVEFKIKEEK